MDFKRVHGDRYIYKDKYRGNNDKSYTILCRIHGKFKMRPESHKRGYGCQKCAVIKVHDLQRYSTEKVVKIFETMDLNDEYDYKLMVYRGRKHTIKIIHKTCGKITILKADSHFAGSGCKYCKTSKGVKKILYFLDSQNMENNVDFHMEKRFSDCINIKTLPFDFYIDSHTILNKHDKYDRIWGIEHDGDQHIKITEHWGGLDKFITNSKCDAIKNKYCEDNGISLIRIPHTIKTQDEINEYLEDKFYNSTFEELVEHNKNLEKEQQKVIKEYENKLEELAKKELKEVIHLLKF
jgi:hypothetical protein